MVPLVWGAEGGGDTLAGKKNGAQAGYSPAAVSGAQPAMMMIGAINVAHQSSRRRAVPNTKQWGGGGLLMRVT